MKKILFLSRRNKISSVLCLYGLILLLSNITQNIFFFEWIISFAPYLILFSILTCGIVLIKRELMKNPFFIVSIILIISMTLLIGKTVLTFTTALPEKGTGTKIITLAFFNKYIYNSDYEAISRVMQRINPDIVGFAEITNADLKRIKELKKYPYKRLKLAKDEFAFGLFSRFPLEKAAKSKEQGIFASKVIIKDVSYTIVLVHPLPPLTPESLWMRNKQLEAIHNHVKNAGAGKTVLMGDFNTTPWSKTYDVFVSDLKELKNVSRGRGLQFTWGFVPILAQIDHIFVPSRLAIESFRVEYVGGSDHRLIWSKVRF